MPLASFGALSRSIACSGRDSSSRSTDGLTCVELGLQGVPFQRQVPVTLDYKGHLVGESRVDLLVAGRLVVELKAVDAPAPIHGVQIRSYLKATKCVLGLLINFNVPVLLRGVRRVILSC